MYYNPTPKNEISDVERFVFNVNISLALTSCAPFIGEKKSKLVDSLIANQLKDILKWLRYPTTNFALFLINKLSLP